MEGVDLSVVSEENPLAEAGPPPSVDTIANTILGAVGGGVLIRGGAKVLSPLVKKYGPAAVQRARDLAIRATTKPNPAATPRVGDAPGQIRYGVVQPTQRVRIPKGQPGAGRYQVGPPGRVVDPLRIGAGAALGAKAVGSFMDEEFPVAPTDVTVPTEADIFRRDAPAALVSAIDANEGEQAALRAMFPDAPEMTAEERTAERARIARGGGDRPARRGAGLPGAVWRPACWSKLNLTHLRQQALRKY